jgi:predicted NAD/FAD-binding protein
MKIAIVGSGISGMTAAYLLDQDHDITVFEANEYVGGHTHTHDVTVQDKQYAVDSGFIVFNETTYPNFLKLIKKLGVEYQPSTMTFSVKSERTGLEYSPHTLNTFFIQRKNLLSTSFYRMIQGILRFRNEYDQLLAEDPGNAEVGPFLRERGYSQSFLENFLIPLGSSLWSADPRDLEHFPLQTFVTFFKNHGFLEREHPLEWKVIKGGSRSYIKKLTASYADKTRLNARIQRITRHAGHVEVLPQNGKQERFDHVVLACHSDQALAMLKDPSPVEREVLGAIPYQKNDTVLHTDTRILPQRRAIWSSWNYLVPRAETGRAILTYDMNILQSIQAPVEFCVTLNRESDIAEDKVIGKYLYHHPIYLREAPKNQRRHREISGKNRTHYCGAYWGYGFHEDGVSSALAACNYFGKGL